jgi:hypothetical protein
LKEAAEWASRRISTGSAGFEPTAQGHNQIT